MPRSKWIFEPGHTAAEFRARHMMVTNVRGHFKNIEGIVEIDFENPLDSVVEVSIDASTLSTGESDRDAHLRHADFLDIENYPTIRFKGNEVVQIGENHFTLTGSLTIRGVTREVTLDVNYLGEWDTPYWVGDQNLGPIRRLGFEAITRINRQDFGVSWNSSMDKGGVVVGNRIDIVIDVEALSEDDMTKTEWGKVWTAEYKNGLSKF